MSTPNPDQPVTPPTTSAGSVAVFCVGVPFALAMAATAVVGCFIPLAVKSSLAAWITVCTLVVVGMFGDVPRGGRS